MELRALQAWHHPIDLLDQLQAAPILSKQAQDNYHEAWVIARFGQLVFSEPGCQVRLNKDNFPDAQVKILESGYVKEVEITQAFDTRSEPRYASQFRIYPTTFEARRTEFLAGEIDASSSWDEEAFLLSVQAALDKKRAKHYSVRPHLLIYINNIPTEEQAIDALEAHSEWFEEYRKCFTSVSILTHGGSMAVQILPKFKAFMEM